MTFPAAADETRTTATFDKFDPAIFFVSPRGSPPSRAPVRTIKNALQQKKNPRVKAGQRSALHPTAYIASDRASDQITRNVLRRR